MPDKWGRMTGGDWMGYANQVLGLAGNLQNMKKQKAIMDSVDVDKVGAVKGATYEEGKGTTVYGEGVDVALGGALSRVEANPALAAQSDLAALQYHADEQQAMAQDLIFKNAQMDDISSKIASQFQSDFDTAIKMNPESPDLAMTSIYQRMKEMPEAKGMDESRLRTMVGNKMLEQYLNTDDAKLKMKQNSVAKTQATVQSLQQNSDRWGKQAMAYNQASDPAMKQAIGKALTTDVFDSLFDTMYGAAFTYAPTADGIEIIHKAGPDANKTYKIIKFDNPNDVNEVFNGALSLSSNPQSAEMIEKRIQDSQVAKLSILMDRRPGTAYKPMKVYDKFGQEHDVTMGDNLFLSKDGTMLMNSMGTKMYPMNDSRNIDAMNNIEFTNELDGTSQRALIKQYQSDVETLGEEGALLNYNKAYDMMLANKKVSSGKIIDQEYLDNYITIMKRQGSNEEMAGFMQSLNKLYDGVAIPAYQLADGTTSPEGASVAQYIQLQANAMRTHAESKALEEQRMGSQMAPSHAPTPALMQGQPAQVQPGASTFQGALAAEPPMAPSPALPRTGTETALKGKPMQGMNLLEATKEGGKKAGKALKDMGLTDWSTQNAEGAETIKDTKSDLQRQSTLWGSEYQGMSDKKKMRQFVTNVNKYRNNPPPNSDQAYAAVDTAMNVFSGEIGGENLDSQGISDVREFMYNIALHESDGLKHTKQKRGGPARGWWQVEPASARDWLKTSGMYGPKAEKAVGYSKAELLKMSKNEFARLLENPTVSAVFGTGIFLQHN